MPKRSTKKYKVAKFKGARGYVYNISGRKVGLGKPFRSRAHLQLLILRLINKKKRAVPYPTTKHRRRRVAGKRRMSTKGKKRHTKGKKAKKSMKKGLKKLLKGKIPAGVKKNVFMTKHKEWMAAHKPYEYKPNLSLWHRPAPPPPLPPRSPPPLPPRPGKQTNLWSPSVINPDLLGRGGSYQWTGPVTYGSVQRDPPPRRVPPKVGNAMAASPPRVKAAPPSPYSTPSKFKVMSMDPKSPTSSSTDRFVKTD